MSAKLNERFPAGVDLIKAGKCPLHLAHPLACFACAYGHMTECHHPMTCEEAECSHFQSQKEVQSIFDEETGELL